MKEARAPGLMNPLIAKLAPYITTIITDKVVVAKRPPENNPITFCYMIRLGVRAMKLQKDRCIHIKLTACLSPSCNVSSTF